MTQRRFAGMGRWAKSPLAANCNGLLLLAPMLARRSGTGGGLWAEATLSDRRRSGSTRSAGCECRACAGDSVGGSRKPGGSVTGRTRTETTLCRTGGATGMRTCGCPRSDQGLRRPWIRRRLAAMGLSLGRRRPGSWSASCRGRWQMASLPSIRTASSTQIRI